MKFMSLFLVSFLAAPLALACLNEPEISGQCPVQPVHLEQLREYYSCEGKKDSDCRQKALSLPTEGIAAFFGSRAARAMSPEQAAKAIDDFFEKNGKNIAEQLAKDEYYEAFRKSEISKGDITKLKQTYRRLEIQARAGNQAAQVELNKLIRENQAVLNTIKERNGGNLFGKGDRKALFNPEYVRGPKGQWIDLANTDWEDLPENFKPFKNMQNPIKDDFRRAPNNVVDFYKRELKAGKTLEQIRKTHMDGNRFMNEELRHKVHRSILKEAHRHRISNPHADFARYVGRGRVKSINDLDKKHRAHFNTKKLPIRFFASGVLAGVSLLAAGVTFVVENQQQCDAMYPFMEVDWQSSQVPGLPHSMHCHMILPEPGKKPPQKVIDFLDLPPGDQYDILNSSTAGKSPCGYYKQVYEKLMCDTKDKATERSEKSAR